MFDFLIGAALPSPPPITFRAIDPKHANRNAHIIHAKTHTKKIRGRLYEFTYHARKGWRRRFVG